MYASLCYYWHIVNYRSGNFLRKYRYQRKMNEWNEILTALDGSPLENQKFTLITTMHSHLYAQISSLTIPTIVLLWSLVQQVAWHLISCTVNDCILHTSYEKVSTSTLHLELPHFNAPRSVLSWYNLLFDSELNVLKLGTLFVTASAKAFIIIYW